MIGSTEVYALSPTSVQVVWRRRRKGSTTLSIGNQERRIATDELVVAWEPDDLAPDTAFVILADGETAGIAKTLPQPSGDVARIATISDLHLGEPSFGEAPRRALPDSNHSWVAFRAAVAEIKVWKPQVLIVKGDIAHVPDAEEYDAFAAEIAASGLTTIIVPGNHDGGNHLGPSVEPALARHDLTLTTDLTVLDLPNLRVIAANSRQPGIGRGHIVAEDAVLDAAGKAVNVLLATHHQFMRHQFPRYWPPGMLHREGEAFLQRLVCTQPRTLITSGHTHRNRVRSHGPLLLTEVGSTKDHPGGWAGYIAGSNGITQTVRRTADPTTLAWTESTRAVGLGSWGRWSPGQLRDRSFFHSWPG